MAITIFILILLSIFHFIYDGILAPTLRLKLRYRLFALRDQLFSLKINPEEKLSEEMFLGVTNSINSAINNLPYISITMVISINKAIKNDAGLKRQVEQTIEMINQSRSEKLKEIAKGLIKCNLSAFAINSGGWIVYLMPLIAVTLVYALLEVIINSLTSYFRLSLLAPVNEWFKKISYTPEDRISGFHH